jgi:Leucine Rich repeat
MRSENDPEPRANPGKVRLSRHRFVVRIVFLFAALSTAMFAWIVYQVHCFRREQQARTILEAEVYLGAIGLTSLASVGGSTAEEVPYISLSELQHGRLYVPVTHVSMGGGGWPSMTQKLEQMAWDRLRSFHYLERLEVSGCAPEPSLEADFSAFTHLRSVTIVETPFSGQNVRTLARLPELQNAVFERKQGIDEWLPSIAQLRYLRTLAIQGDVSDQGVASLAGLDALESLSVESDRITSRMVSSLVRLRNLKFLNLSHSPIGDDGLRQLSELNGLTELHLGNSDGISDEGVTFLAALESLETLNLSSTRITSKSAPTLARMRNLKQLMLPNTQFDGDGLRRLAAIKGLMVLELKGTAIADIGGDLRFPELGYLGLQDTKLTDAALCHVSQSPKLRCLVIAGTRVTNASIATLAAMPSLMDVYAYDTQIDQNSPQWLRLMKTLESRRARQEDGLRQSDAGTQLK